MKTGYQQDPDRVFQHFMDSYGYLIGAAAMICGFVLIAYLIMQ